MLIDTIFSCEIWTYPYVFKLVRGFETSPQHVHRCTIPLRTLGKFSQLGSGGCRAFDSTAAAYSCVVLPRIPHYYAVQAVANLGSCRSFDTGIEFRGGNFCDRENHAICGARSRAAPGSSLMVTVGRISGLCSQFIAKCTSPCQASPSPKVVSFSRPRCPFVMSHQISRADPTDGLSHQQFSDGASASRTRLRTVHRPYRIL